MRLVLSLLVVLVLLLPGVSAPASVQADACRAESYDGEHTGKSVPYENEMRVVMTDGCHEYRLSIGIPREALLGAKTGKLSVVIGDGVYPGEGTLPDFNEVGYCGAAAAQAAHNTFKFHFNAPLGTEVRLTFDCTRPL